MKVITMIFNAPIGRNTHISFGADYGSFKRKTTAEGVFSI